MNLGLLVLPALAGYLFLTRTFLFRYQIKRESGYRLFFKSALAGVAVEGPLSSARRTLVSGGYGRGLGRLQQEGAELRSQGDRRQHQQHQADERQHGLGDGGEVLLEGAHGDDEVQAHGRR